MCQLAFSPTPRSGKTEWSRYHSPMGPNEVEVPFSSLANTPFPIVPLLSLPTQAPATQNLCEVGWGAGGEVSPSLHKGGCTQFHTTGPPARTQSLQARGTAFPHIWKPQVPKPCLSPPQLQESSGMTPPGPPVGGCIYIPAKWLQAREKCEVISDKVDGINNRPGPCGPGTALGSRLVSKCPVPTPSGSPFL